MTLLEIRQGGPVPARLGNLYENSTRRMCGYLGETQRSRRRPPRIARPDAD